MPKKFDKFVEKIKKQYIKKGYTREEARNIAYATATKKFGYKGKNLK